MSILAELQQWADDIRRSSGPSVDAEMLERARDEALEDAARLHENINPACDHERVRGDPGAGAMGAVIEYRDAIRALKDSP